MSALIHRKEGETKMLEKWGNFENVEQKKSKFLPELNHWHYGNWPGILDHLAVSLVDDKYKKLNKWKFATYS